jgi:hypothetical protein
MSPNAVRSAQGTGVDGFAGTELVTVRYGGAAELTVTAWLR